MPLPRILYANDYVAAVAATTASVAEDAIRLIQAEYEVYPFVTRVEDSMKPDAIRARDDRPNVVSVHAGQAGDVEAAMQRADVTIDATYATQVQEHACLESMTITCWWPDELGLTMWATTQSVFIRRIALAQQFGMPPDDITVLCERVGGAFGAKMGAGKLPP